MLFIMLPIVFAAQMHMAVQPAPLNQQPMVNLQPMGAPIQPLTAGALLPQAGAPVVATASNPAAPILAPQTGAPLLPQAQAAPGAVGVNCKQILDPNFCKGPAMEYGYICSWQENECEAIDPNEHKSEGNGDACKALSNNQVACHSKPGCVFEDFECKIQKQPLAPVMHNGGTVPSPYAGFTPQVPAQGFGPIAGGYSNGVSPMAPGMLPHNGMPPTHQAGAQQPGVPSAHQPGVPSAHQPGLPSAQQPGLPSAHQSSDPSANIAPAHQPGSAPGNSIQHIPTDPPRPLIPQQCKTLTQALCFGPSVTPQELCIWDGEDAECMSSPASDIEAICKQFAQDPIKCDEHENCFWDELDFECAENKFPTPAEMGQGKGGKPVFVSSVCSSFKDVNSCAAQAKCFWDSTAYHVAGVCVNVIQAQNVCRVLNSPVHCSTNMLCHWRGNVCQASAGLRAVFHKPTSSLPSNDENSSEWKSYTFMGIYASILGVMVGLTFSWARSKCSPNQDSNNDYRDISLDINSQRQV